MVISHSTATGSWYGIAADDTACKHKKYEDTEVNYMLKTFIICILS
jgi:hypothetical protein